MTLRWKSTENVTSRSFGDRMIRHNAHMANLRISVWLVTVRSSLGSTIVVDDVAVAADSI